MYNGFSRLLLVAGVLLYLVTSHNAYADIAPEITSFEIIQVCSDTTCKLTNGQYMISLPGSRLQSFTAQQIGYSSNNTATFNNNSVSMNDSITLYDQNNFVYGFDYIYNLSGSLPGMAKAYATNWRDGKQWSASIYITLNPTLTVTKLGTGSGIVTPDSGSLSWAGNVGTGNYTSGLEVVLLATPVAGSSFDSWSGACTNSSGPCDITMDSNKAVSATFTVIPNAKIGDTYYGTLSNAYSAITSDGVIEAKDMTFTEDLTLDRDVSFTLAGGYADDYGSITGFTTLNGILTISSGSMIVDSLIIL